MSTIYSKFHDTTKYPQHRFLTCRNERRKTVTQSLTEGKTETELTAKFFNMGEMSLIINSGFMTKKDTTSTVLEHAMLLFRGMVTHYTRFD